MSSPTKKIGDLLVESGICSQQQLSLALKEQTRTGGMIGDILESHGFIPSGTIDELLSTEERFNYVNLSEIVVDQAAISEIPLNTAKRYEIFPFLLDEGRLSVAFGRPDDVLAIDKIREETDKEIVIYSATERDILEAQDKYYLINSDIDNLADRLIKNTASLNDDELETSVTMLVQNILMKAIKDRASDIHFTPNERALIIRFKHSGDLRTVSFLPKQLAAAITTRIKNLSGLNITESRHPQDGQMSIPFGRRNIDIRVSTLPIIHGESVVLRILDKSAVKLDLESLGVYEDEMAIMQAAINNTSGVILVTGPTGSGKTTTNYSLLNMIDASSKSIFTLEDPIEYRFPLIRQSQINESIGYSFADGLRSILRQDPEVIMVGEIRDNITAELAFRASMTGHLVLTTLHTDDAPSTILRLADMNVDTHLIPSTVNLIIAQRLVKRLCDHCKVEDTSVSNDDLTKSGMPELIGHEIYKESGLGCSSCYGGWAGRIGIFELLIMNDDYYDLLLSDKINTRDIRKLAVSNGMTTLKQAGIRKVLDGFTSFEEISHSVG